MLYIFQKYHSDHLSELAFEKKGNNDDLVRFLLENLVFFVLSIKSSF